MTEIIRRETTPARRGIFYGFIIVGVASLILALTYGTRSAFGVFFKPMAHDFGWTRAMTSGAFSISLAIEGLMGIVMGGINDRFGPRVVLMVCAALIGLGFFLMSEINAIWQLYLFYGLVIGMGSGGTFIPLVSTVSRWFIKRRTLMTGIVVSGIGLGTLLLPPLANQLILTYGWRKSYLIMGVLTLVIAMACAWFLRRDPAQKGDVPYGEGNNVSDRADTKASGYSFGEAVFTRQFWMVYFIMFCFGFTAFSFGPHFVPHITDQGISPGSAAMVISVTGGVSIIGSLLLGNLADRIGNSKVFAVGLLGLVIYYAGLIPARELEMFYLLASVSSFTAGGAGACESPLIASLFGLKSHGLIYGVVGTGFTLGAAIGPYLTGYIYDVNASYNVALITNAILGIIGIILALLLKPTAKR